MSIYDVYREKFHIFQLSFFLPIFAEMDGSNNKTTDLHLFEAIRSGSTKAFALLFNKYYSDLVLYCGTYIQDQTVCEDIVQNIFLKLWKSRLELEITTSLQAYLVRVARNMCLDELRHRKVKAEYVRSGAAGAGIDGEEQTENYVLFSELSSRVSEAVENLPAKEKEAFEMSRIGDLKYRQIAEILGVSQRTVEVRISNALKTIKKSIVDNEVNTD